MAAALSSRAFYLGDLRPLEALRDADASHRLARQTGRASTMEENPALPRVDAGPFGPVTCRAEMAGPADAGMCPWSRELS